MGGPCLCIRVLTMVLKPQIKVVWTCCAILPSLLEIDEEGGA